jgi:hypothetical protein
MAFLSEIETGILDILKLAGLEARPITIEQAQQAVSAPSVHVRIQKWDARKLTAEAFRLTIRLATVVLVSNVRSEEDRRKKIYPLIEAIVGYLTGKRPIATSGVLVPVGAFEATSAEMVEVGTIAWECDFTVVHDVTAVDDETARDIRKIVIALANPTDTDDVWQSGELDLA